MKSAYELAMERLGGTREYSDDVKRALADIDDTYEAHKAEARIRAEDAIKRAAGDSEKQDQIREELSRDIMRFDERKETEKNKVRRAEETG